MNLSISMILWGCLDQVNSKSFQRSPQATYRKSSLCCFSLLFLWDSYWMLVWLISLALFIFFLLLPACSSHWIMTIGLFSSLQILYSLYTMLQLKTCRELIILIIITCMARISVWLFFYNFCLFIDIFICSHIIPLASLNYFNIFQICD